MRIQLVSVSRCYRTFSPLLKVRNIKQPPSPHRLHPTTTEAECTHTHTRTQTQAAHAEMNMTFRESRISHLSIMACAHTTNLRLQQLVRLLLQCLQFILHCIQLQTIKQTETVSFEMVDTGGLSTQLLLGHLLW
jgi:hypothetical protein